MKIPWTTLLCCGVAGPAAWMAGHATLPPASPVPPAGILTAPPLVVVEAASPVLPELFAIAAAAEGAPDAITRQQELSKAARLIADATLAEARELFHTTHDAYLQECAARRWAELEPQSAFDFLLSLDDTKTLKLAANIETLCRAVFQGWAHRDPAAALAAAAPLLSRPGFSLGLNAAALQAIADDPERGLALCAKCRHLRFYIQREARTMWENNPAGFTRGVFLQPRDSTLAYYLQRFAVDAAKAWAATDQTAFTAWAVEHLKTVEGRPKHEDELFALLLSCDPKAAGEVYARTPPSPIRNQMRQQYVARMAAEDPQAAVAWIDENIISGREAAFRVWAEATAKSAGHEQAAVLALALPPGKARDAAATSALYAWAGADLAAALRWTQAQPAERGEPAPITRIASCWLEHNGPEAGRYILEHPDLGWESLAFQSAVLRTPFTEAVALVRDLPEAASASAAKAIGERLAGGKHSLSEIAALPVECQTASIRAAAVNMRYADQAKAAAWVSSLPAGSLRAAGEEALQVTP